MKYVPTYTNDHHCPWIIWILTRKVLKHSNEYCNYTLGAGMNNEEILAEMYGQMLMNCSLMIVPQELLRWITPPNLSTLSNTNQSAARPVGKVAH